MRSAFLLLFLALSAALGWFFLSTAPSTDLPLATSVSARETAPGATREAPIELAAPTDEAPSGDQRSLNEPTDDTGQAWPEIRWNELELLGQLVSHEGEPLSGYTILVAPSGLKPSKAGPVPLAQRCVTDEQGHCQFMGLSGPGPWDVYAFPMALATRDTLERNARVGTVTAKNPGDAERVTFKLETGVVAILRSPLPENVKAEDIWIEAVPSAGFLDQSLHVNQTAPPAGPAAHRFAQGAPSGDENGYVVARLPATVEPESPRGYGVYVRTQDGLFALVATREGVLSQSREVVIDEPLEARGRVSIRLVIDDVRNEPMADADWLQAVGAVDWRLLLDDPGRSSPQLPGSFATTSRNFSWVRTGLSTFELADLPLGVPLEIGATGSDAPPKGRQGAFVAATLTRATPVHGLADPVEVRIRRVR